MDKKEIKRFSIIIPEKDTFKIDENFSLVRRSWDWFFEKNEYEVKKQTIEKLSKMIEVLVNNRDIIDEIFSVCMIDLVTLEAKINHILHNFLISQYSRMIKTSKIIQDLVIEGSYIEAKALLRTNFERMILVNFFLVHQDKLFNYLDAKEKEDMTILNKYSIRKMVSDLKKDYTIYKYLCNFVHANSHLNDLMEVTINKEDWGVLRPYNYFDDEAMVLFGENNNLLIETFHPINLYIRKILPPNAPTEIIALLKKSQDLKIIRIGSKNKD